MPRAKPPIETFADLKRALSKVFYALQEGKMDPKTGSACGYCAQILNAVLNAEKDAGSGPREATPLEILVRHMEAERQEKGLPNDSVGDDTPPQVLPN